MSTIRNVLVAGTACAALLAVPGLGACPARADEPERPPLEVRWHDVSGLTLGRTAFDGERGPTLPKDDGAACVAETPGFAAAGDEKVYVHGQIDEVIELVKARSRRPDAWSEDGVMIAASTSRWIVVRGPERLQEEVAQTLAALERESMATVTVDVMVLEGEPAPGSGGVAAAIARGTTKVVGGLRTSGQLAHRVAAFVGRERTWVVDQEVEVAQDARIVDPFVGMQPEGIAVVVYVDAITPDLALDVRAWTASVAASRTAATSRVDLLDLPDVDVGSVSTLLRVKPGEWSLVPMARGKALAVRATLRDAPRGKPPVALPALPAGGPVEHVEWATLPVSDLGATLPNQRAPFVGLLASNAAPPAGPELAEPIPPVEMEPLVETAKASLDPESWGNEGAALEVKNGKMEVRHDARHIDALRALVDAVRSQAGGTLRFRASVVRLPLASFPEWVAGLDDGATLVQDGGTALLARPGAKEIDTVGVRTMRRGRNAAFGGRTRRFVHDYDVEIAEKSAIGKPLVSTVLEGIALDVEAGGVGNGAGITCEMRLDRSTWDGVREVPTALGSIECPDLGLLRVRAGVAMPLGGTRIVGASVARDEVTLVLLTANAE